MKDRDSKLDDGLGPCHPASLDKLASAWGVQSEYVDALGQRRRASAESVVATLQALGAPMARAEDAPGALRAREAEREARLCEPVTVAWDGAARLRVHESEGARVRLDVQLEHGGTWSADGGVEEGALRIEGVPLGFHEARLDVEGRKGRLTLLSAPRRAFETEARRWGLFAPLYAIHDQESSFADFGTLRRAGQRVSELGGSCFGTLPLLAGFFEELLFEPSPYSPVTRRMWNELYIELRDVPELSRSAEARALLARSPPMEGTHIDYRAAYAHRATVLAALAEACPPERMRSFLAARRDADAYARFRASRHATRARLDSLPTGGDPAWERRRRFHAYAQMVCEEQLERLGRDLDLYLDLPLGVHMDGWDVHEHRDVFAEGAGVGAPPDGLFEGGQSWGFPPVLPEASRRTGHRYLRECLDAHMRHAGTLRIDHVAWLHRLFWVPAGASATEGLYVHNPAPEELYATLTILSQRHRCRLVGEDLGTVPEGVREAMREHGLRRTWVFQFELRDHDPLWDAPPQDSAVTMNTHDTPTFGGWWSEQDVDDRVDLGLYDEELEARERGWRAALRRELGRAFQLGEEPGAVEALEAVLPPLAEGPGELLLVTLEDLWGETEPQNTPGTSDERPNWRRRAHHALEALEEPQIDALLRQIDRRRREGALAAE